MCIVYKLWFVVNVHSTGCNAVCHGPRVYIYRIARHFRGLKFSRIGLPENFRDFIFADRRFDLMTY